MLKVLLATIWFATASLPWPTPSKGLQDLLLEAQLQVRVVKQMGPLCQGGGRKWSKIRRLKETIAQNPNIASLERQGENLLESCLKAAYSGSEFDFHGTELVIPQRVQRSKMNIEEQKACLQYWIDWKTLEAVYALTNSVLSNWEAECLRPQPPPARVEGEVTR